MDETLKALVDIGLPVEDAQDWIEDFDDSVAFHNLRVGNDSKIAGRYVEELTFVLFRCVNDDGRWKVEADTPISPRVCLRHG